MCQACLGAFSSPNEPEMRQSFSIGSQATARAAIGDWRGPRPPAAERRTVERHAAFEASRSRTAAGSRRRTLHQFCRSGVCVTCVFNQQARGRIT